ncbi:MAG TPA: hypothetical protein PLT82_09845 [Candidatus Hydrogenedens sp.]|nr:hypothetical protein [Candidatus Hydrogenedens sp.]HOL19473.1 hypothetical protein [Candidatus Hydrogenedens sp.]HPP59423.1 hypothetical protein [Candidatus Hydrogenedens sp.]
MRTVYVVTMWSGGRPAKKWKSFEYPKLLPQGIGVEFICCETKLKVQIIGSISVEEYESGKEDLEMGLYHELNNEKSSTKEKETSTPNNIERIF